VSYTLDRSDGGLQVDIKGVQVVESVTSGIDCCEDGGRADPYSRGA
jgi:hypothetical protein